MVQLKQLVIITVMMGCALLLSACAGDGDANPGGQTVNAANTTGSENLVAVQQATESPFAAIVNGEPITMAEFERERARRMMGLEVEPATAAAFEASILQSMIDQLLIEQAAEREGVVVTDEEVDAELALHADLAATNDMTLEEIVAAQLYTMDEYREVIRGTLLAQKLSDVVAIASPYAPQVHSRHILVKDESTARALIQQIQGGADFAELAVQHSLDTSTARTGGDLDWVSEGDLLQKEVEDAIFALEPGQLAPEPVQSGLGYHVIQVLERVEDRPLSPAALAEKRQQAFLDWLDNERQIAVIERFVGVNN